MSPADLFWYIVAATAGVVVALMILGVSAAVLIMLGAAVSVWIDKPPENEERNKK